MTRAYNRTALVAIAALVVVALLCWAGWSTVQARASKPGRHSAAAAQVVAPPADTALASTTEAAQIDPADLLTRLAVTTALLLIGGGAAFAVCCVDPALATAGEVGVELGTTLRRRFGALTLPVTATAAGAATLATLGGMPSDWRAALQELAIALSVRSGRVWCALALVLLLAAVALAAELVETWRAAPRSARHTNRRLLTLAALGLATQALQSHFADGASFQQTVSGASVMAIHLFAAAVWAGGLVYGALVCWPAWRRSLPPWQRAIVSDAIARFSPLALACVLLLTASGLFAARGLITPHGLTDSLYGGALDLKMALMIVLIALGAANRRTLAGARAALGRANLADRLTLLLQPGAPTGAPGRKLLAAMRKESYLIALAVAAAAVMLDVGPPQPRPALPPPAVAALAAPSPHGASESSVPLAGQDGRTAAVAGPRGS